MSKIKQHTFLSKYASPVVIGGVGGSGTRLIAQCLREAGFLMGADLNTANDNLWFTLLFKRFEILSSSDQEFDELLRILISGMTNENDFTKRQISLTHILASRDREQHSAAWLGERARTLLANKAVMTPEDRWGWKEPNSHIVLDRLNERLDTLKYIHVARNGLDMAHSNNQNQLRLWGPHFLGEAFSITPYYSLKYWCIVHKRVLKIGESMGSRFLFLNYDTFCLQPENGIKQLCKFLELDTDSIGPQLTKLVAPPESIGRFKRHSTEIFADEDVAYTKLLGFDVGH